MTLNYLYDVVYQLQVREHFAAHLCVCISREAFIEVHAECRKKKILAHLKKGPRHFLELNVDGVTVIWSSALKGDLSITGAECFCCCAK